MSPPPITRPFRLDLPALERLLRESGGGASGLPDALDDYLVARVGERIVGAVGAAYRGSAGVLRALAVAPGAEAAEVEQALVQALVADARRMGARYLLVPSGWGAERFAALGFAVPGDAARDAARAADLAPLDGYLALPVD
jgi:N-acetylglutamate synthase-like GNAT family acetyltransferase